MPSAVHSTAFTYSIPGFNATLTLGRTTLVDIFLGKIVQWDDPRILADNPLIAPSLFTNNTITLVARGSPSIDNLIINAVFSKVSQEWADLANQTIGGFLPTPVYALPHVHTAVGNDDLLGITHDSSLGYAPWSIVRAFSQPTM